MSKLFEYSSGSPLVGTDTLVFARAGAEHTAPVSDVVALVSAASGLFTPGGRLTLTTGVPVTTSDVTAAGTLYYTPYVHDYIMLYSGTAWTLVQFAELSLSLSGFTAAKPYDIFCYNNSGTATLEALVWTNTTTRATALVRQNGRLCKTGALTRLYLGTIFMSATSQTQDAVAGRYVVNMYNQVPTIAQLTETADISTTSDTYADATATLSVLALGGEAISSGSILSKGTNATQDHRYQVDLDSTTQVVIGQSTAGTAAGWPPAVAQHGTVAAGIHLLKLQWKRVSASATATNRPTTDAGINYRWLYVAGLMR